MYKYYINKYMYIYFCVLIIVLILICDFIILINRMFQTNTLFSYSKCVRCVLYIHKHTMY